MMQHMNMVEVEERIIESKRTFERFRLHHCERIYRQGSESLWNDELIRATTKR